MASRYRFANEMKSDTRGAELSPSCVWRERVSYLDEGRVGVKYLRPFEHILENIARLVPQPTARFYPEEEAVL